MPVLLSGKGPPVLYTQLLETFRNMCIKITQGACPYGKYQRRHEAINSHVVRQAQQPLKYVCELEAVQPTTIDNSTITGKIDAQ